MGIMWEVMKTFVIMHNMIVEDKRDDIIYDQGWKFKGYLVEPHVGPLGQHLGNNSGMCILCCVIRPLMTAFKPI
jgi:hypothetical protein